MEPSSLVFLAIVAVWAAYLIPTRLRRRVHLAQSRTRDRFSSGVRVLHRPAKERDPSRPHRSGGSVLASPSVNRSASVATPEVPAAPAASATPHGRVLTRRSAGPGSGRRVVAAAAEPSRGVTAKVAQDPPVAAGDGGAAVTSAAAERAAARALGDAPSPSATDVALRDQSTPAAAELDADLPEFLLPKHGVPGAPPVSRRSAVPAREPVEALRAKPAPRPPAKKPLAPRPRSVGEAEKARARAAQREAQVAHVAALERARAAAARRARVMLALLVLTTAAWAVSIVTASPLWVAVPPTAMLVVHTVLGRLAAVRSKRTLSAGRRRLADATRAADHAAGAPSHRGSTRPPTPAADRRPAAHYGVTADVETWDPVPVPPPTYTLKPAVHRPEPPPLPEPVPYTPVPHAPAAATRATLPRRAEDIERILDLDAAAAAEERRSAAG